MFRALGIIAGVFSLTIMAWKGFDLHFGPTLLRVLGTYENEMQTAFSIVEPIIKDQLSTLRSYFGWDLHLYPHWKHVFVLMWLYFGARDRVAWSADQKGTAVFFLLFGLLVALAAGVASGTVAQTNMLLAVFPIAGVVLFDLGRSAWRTTFDRRAGKSWQQDFLRRASPAFARAVIGGVVLAGALSGKVSFVNSLPNPSLAVLFFLVVLFALYRVLKGASEASGNRIEGDTWWRAFLRRRSAQVGILMLATIGGAIGFVVADAGLHGFAL